MSQNLSKIEKWILDTMVITHLRELNEHGERVWSTEFLVDAIPPSYTASLESSKDVTNALIHLIQLGYAKQMGGPNWDPHCTIEPEGVFSFKKSLNPLATTIKDKKSYNDILEKTLGNPEVREEFKKLGNELRGKIESEIIDGILRYLIRRGPEAVLYLIELLEKTDISS